AVGRQDQRAGQDGVGGGASAPGQGNGVGEHQVRGVSSRGRPLVRQDQGREVHDGSRRPQGRIPSGQGRSGQGADGQGGITMSFFDQVAGALGAALGDTGGERTGLVTNVIEMLGKGQAGGLGGVVQAFEAKGLGNVVSSWISTGANLPISADQIRQVLGS